MKMINKENLDTIINDVTWSYEECGGEVPQNILDTLNEIKQVQSILNEYNVTPENIREVLLTGQMFRNQSNPSLLECIKEWNEKGFDVDVYALEINIHNYSTVDKEEHGIEFSIDLEKKTLFMEGEYNSFPYDVVHLLSKTLKALEITKDE
jgi:hypothetical protein